jgi:putative tricarboxylic transport membrane protein
MEMWLQGFLTALTPVNILYLFLGTIYGLIIGVLPGLSATFGVASMLPLTYALKTDTAIIFLAAIHASSIYGDSICSILINVPGGPGSVATCWDGNALARKGQGGMALGISAGGSLFGGIIGWICLAIMAPLLMIIAINIGAPEYAMLAVMALSLLSVAAQGETIKGLIMGSFGVMLSLMGPSPVSGKFRFTFGLKYFQDNLDIIPVVLGLFAMSQAISIAMEGPNPEVGWTEAKDSVLSGLKFVFKYPATLVRSGIIGLFIGIMPALGTSTANIVAYFMEKKASGHQETFGQGEPRGLLAPEVSKSSCCVGDLIPTFTLGIPGSAATTLFLAALMLHGIQPGPEFFQKGVLSYTVFVGILFAQFLFFLFGITTARYFALVLKLKNAFLVPGIALLSVLGSYGMRNDMADVLVTCIFGVLGYIFSKHRWPSACVVLGLVMGYMLESNFQRALIISEGSYMIFLTEPISLVIIILTALFLAWPYIVPAVKAIPQWLAPGEDED